MPGNVLKRLIPRCVQLTSAAKKIRQESIGEPGENSVDEIQQAKKMSSKPKADTSKEISNTDVAVSSENAKKNLDDTQPSGQKNPTQIKKQQDDVDKREFDKFKKFRRPTKPPNYFLAVQITDHKIKGSLKAVQDHIVKQDERLKKAVVDIASAHLTLGLLHLPDENAITEACTVLENCRKPLEEIVQNLPLNLTVNGVGHFNKKVLYAKVVLDENEQKLRLISELLRDKFNSLKPDNKFDYKPHLTIMKLSKVPFKLKKKIRRIDENYFQSFNDMNFGIQSAQSVQILSMFEMKQRDGYYHCESEIPLYTELLPQTAVQDAAVNYANSLTSYCITSSICEILAPTNKNLPEIDNLSQIQTGATHNEHQCNAQEINNNNAARQNNVSPSEVLPEKNSTGTKTLSDLAADGGSGDALSLPTSNQADKKASLKTGRSKQGTKKRVQSKKSEKTSKVQTPPNYFLAVQIANPEMKGALKAVQDNIVRQELLLQKVVVNITNAHLTLGLLHLPDEKMVAEAHNVLKDCESGLAEMTSESPVNLTISGIGHFDKKVVFVKVVQDESEQKMKDIAKFLQEKFDNLKTDNPFSYKPHLTLMKMSKLKSRKWKKKIRCIDPKYFARFGDIRFGIEPIRSVQLLSMYKKKQKDGYYHSEAEIPLGLITENLPNDDPDTSYAKFLANYCITNGICEILAPASNQRESAQDLALSNASDSQLDAGTISSNVNCEISPKPDALRSKTHDPDDAKQVNAVAIDDRISKSIV